MGTPEEESKAILAAQESANNQSVLNTINLKQYFGPRIDALTASIDRASNSSSFLSKVLIGVTIIGTIIAGISWYQESSEKRVIQSLSTEHLRCTFDKAIGKGDLAMLAAIELCKREKLP